jgi:exodeoxyribonuclease V beta subunit
VSAVVFDTPLQARSLVEASAGTGKTYALAGLFARAVIAGRLRVPQVLAVTYTVAATEELRERVRLRLQRAAVLAAHWQPGDAAERAGDGAEDALLRALLHAALRDDTGESADALRLRLARAVRDLDLAAITTIHGFCQRLLSEHALLAGEPLQGGEVEPANAARRARLAVALWRQHGGDAAGADFLHRHFGTPDALAASLDDLLAPEPLLPPPAAMLPPDPRPALQAAWQAFRTSFEVHGVQARAAFEDAIARKQLHGQKYRAAHVDALWTWLQAQVRQASPPSQWHERLDRFTRDALREGCNKGGAAPESPLCDAIAALLAARDAVAPWQEACDLQRLHALRADAQAQDRAHKQAFAVRDYDDLVGAVHAAVQDPGRGGALAAALRAQYPLVLVDEFQDTDARQWTIFARLFGDDGGLVLVGDPKQAIYRFRGGDVETYLAARGGVDGVHALRENFRSRPSLIAAVNALFAAAPADALGEGIGFAPALAGGQVGDDALQCDGAPAPALHFHAVPPRLVNGQPREWNKEDATALAAELCARAVRDRLLQARDGRLQRRTGDGLRPLEPRDCAVLVREHREARAVRQALARLGVPAASAGRQSLFEGEQAQELLALLLAAAAPGDERRLRALLATPLFGLDAAALQALADDGEALRGWQQELLQWRLRWRQHGPQAMLATIVARQAPALLAQADGERRLTHLLQLAELMQEARAARLGPQGQVDWLRERIAHADRDDEAQWPRLESDAGRVQILTLHGSKGLEFPLVFLPFVGIGRGNGQRGDFVDYHDAAGRRVRQWRTAYPHAGAPDWDEACRRARAESDAEDMRLLYVGLTRAREALWLCGGALASAEKAALRRLLGGEALPPAVRERPGVVASEGLPGAGDDARLPPVAATRVPPAREPRRRLQRDWWIHSFSQLHRQQAHGTHALAEEAAADDERVATAVALPPARFGGVRFGNALHHALEHVDFAAWRDAGDAVDAMPPGQAAVLEAALRSQDYPQAEWPEALRELAPLVARTLNAPLPEGLRLCELPPPARVAELEFHFVLADADAAALLALLHAHGIARERRDFGAWPRLSGLMTGKIDLTYVHAGRAYVLDYKSNRLPAYDAGSLARAMAASEYDLQALLYVVALHRWLRVRRGAAYDCARDVGGVRYLFCRGLDAADPARGVAVPRFDAALVAGVDALLGGAA